MADRDTSKDSNGGSGVKRPEPQANTSGVISPRDRVPDPGQRGAASGGSEAADPAGNRLAGTATPGTPGGATGTADKAPDPDVMSGLSDSDDNDDASGHSTGGKSSG